MKLLWTGILGAMVGYSLDGLGFGVTTPVYWIVGVPMAILVGLLA
jgi:hypothetical protein